MSWSIAATGTKDEVKAMIASQAQSAAANYAGKPEADDVVAAKDRVLALVDALVVKDGEAVGANAYGSHSVDQDGLRSASASFSVSARAPG
jgi:hypothetical protein